MMTIAQVTHLVNFSGSEKNYRKIVVRITNFALDTMVGCKLRKINGSAIDVLLLIKKIVFDTIRPAFQVYAEIF